jgi:Na+-translocating ferredoxin:NAD+ oxidoreductase subunit E
MPKKQKQPPLSDIFLRGSLIHNPVLVQVIGICPVVAAAVSFRAAALLAVIYSLILIVTQVIASAFLKRIVRWVRVAVYLIIGLIIVSPFIYYLEKYDIGIRITLGIYLPLLAANSLAALRCEKVAVRNTVKYSFFDAIAASAGYSAVLLLVGFIRELLGSGSIFENPIGFLPRASGMLMPFGGFIVLGFMAALLRAYIIRRYPKYAKAMNIEISPTTVTLKFKPDEEPVPEPVDTQIPAETPEPAASYEEAETETATDNTAVEDESSPESAEEPDEPLPGENSQETPASADNSAPPEQEPAEATGEQNEPLEEIPANDSQADDIQANDTPVEAKTPPVSAPAEVAGDATQAEPDASARHADGFNQETIDLRIKELLDFLDSCDIKSASDEE